MRTEQEDEPQRQNMVKQNKPLFTGKQKTESGYYMIFISYPYVRCYDIPPK